MAETRADIKDRMLRAASAAWGYADKIREVDFDPLLGLLMEVFSAELEKISNEISMSRERVLQKMVQLLAPDVLTAPVPAHAILHIQGLGEKLLLDDREQFFSGIPSGQSNPSGQTTREETWFSPAGSYYITDTAIKYMVMGERIVRYTSVTSRENWWPLKTALPSHTIWLGLTGKEAAVTGAQFYFELHHEQAGPAFYHHLPDAEWWCGSQLLDIKKGFNSPETDEGMLAEWLQAPHHISQAADRLARAIYQDRFVHVAENEFEQDKLNSAPDELYQHLPDAVNEQWKNEKLVWIKINFPESIQPATLMDLHCQVNCFPVVNRQLHELTYRLREWINIIPLSGERGQQFLDLHAVTDQDGNSLLGAIGRKEDNAKDETGRKMSVLLRRGGAGRFDERDARSITEHLLQLLRDESAAFSLYNREFMTGEIKQVQQVITRISRQMENRDTPADATPYLEVTGNESGDSRHLAVAYWSTQGAKANLIKGGTALMAYKNGGVRQGTIVLMTPVQGGRNRLLPHESIPAYKSAVLSKDRVLSVEDIRLFCIRETGARASSIIVRKGVMIAQGRQSGYVKTIDVLICPDAAHYERMLASGTPEHWQQVLQMRLAERSMSFMPFRVYLKKEYEPVNRY
jgi:hypothetical protein